MTENFSGIEGSSSSTSGILLRDVTDDDLSTFFEQQLDPTANHMAAFTAKNPADRQAFNAHWAKILADDSIIKKSILFEGQVAGHILSFEQFGKPAVSYWIGKEYWGKGLATKALAAILKDLKVRPLYARAAKDNIASLRVLEKCGFAISGEDKGLSNARGEQVEEFILKLDTHQG
jgi:RimJ/RimL family protein N-acetyltransferase